jgi:hypothetical protein
MRRRYLKRETCLIDNQKVVRANAFRFLGYFSTTERIILFKDGNVEIFIVRTLTLRREQAIRLIRACFDIPGASEHIPECCADSCLDLQTTG